MALLNKQKQFDVLKINILEAINDTNMLNRKPKDFNKDAFLNQLNNILTDYEEKHCC